MRTQRAGTSAGVVPLDRAANNRLALTPPISAFERVNPHLARDYRSRLRARQRRAEEERIALEIALAAYKAEAAKAAKAEHLQYASPHPRKAGPVLTKGQRRLRRELASGSLAI